MHWARHWLRARGHGHRNLRPVSGQRFTAVHSAAAASARGAMWVRGCTNPSPHGAQLIISLSSCTAPHLTASDGALQPATKCCHQLQHTWPFFISFPAPSPSFLLSYLFKCTCSGQGPARTLLHSSNTYFSAVLSSAKASRAGISSKENNRLDAHAIMR